MNKFAMSEKNKTIIIALGGSIIFPENIDIKFLKNFKNFVQKWHRKKKFIIVIGGGQLCRIYQRAASQITNINNEDRDWLGIHVTRVNAHLLRTIFREIADPVVIDNVDKIKNLKYSVTIASGWKPGWSTDYVAIAKIGRAHV